MPNQLKYVAAFVAGISITMAVVFSTGGYTSGPPVLVEEVGLKWRIERQQRIEKIKELEARVTELETVEVHDSTKINSDKLPEELAKELRINRLQQGMSESEGPRPFPIRRYLRLAEHLQSLPERERVTWLRMASANRHLREPAILLARMLIQAKPGVGLREIHDAIGSHGASQNGSMVFPDPPVELPFPYLDPPLEIYQGVPFYVDNGFAVMMGWPEDASAYIEYLLANGTWRNSRFKSLSQKQVMGIADDYLKSLKAMGLDLPEWFEKQIRLQASIGLNEQSG